MALLQTILCFVAAIFLGMKFSFSIILTIIFILPIGLVFISSGLLLGSLLSEKAVGGMSEKIAYAFPFFHAVEMGRAGMKGQYADMLPHAWWVLGYGLVISIGAVYVFPKKMKI